MSIESNGYQSGFGNEFASEAVPGALPVGRNSPQKVAHGLYAEQISGTAFTAPRHANRRSWLYRIRPAAMHGEFQPFAQPNLHNDFETGPVTPDQLRWSPLPIPEMPTDFVDGLVTMAGNGSPASQSGIGIHMYAANRDMVGRFFYDADGELLIVPQHGRLHTNQQHRRNQKVLFRPDRPLPHFPQKVLSPLRAQSVPAPAFFRRRILRMQGFPLPAPSRALHAISAGLHCAGLRRDSTFGYSWMEPPALAFQSRCKASKAHRLPRRQPFSKSSLRRRAQQSADQPSATR